MKNKAAKKAKVIAVLPKAEQEIVKEYFQKNPEKIWGEQKSLLKGHSDLPLFRAASDEKQQDLFEQ
jgi:uncharacterized protein (DUF1810 family)